jgi:23S rRNA (cytosine1962-C5)-methyltransferase
MIEFTKIKEIILNNIKTKNQNFKRIFHGRGYSYDGYHFLVIDSIDRVLHIAYFKEIDENLHVEFMDLFKEIYKTKTYDAIILQKRYLTNAPKETIFGVLPEEIFAYEDGMKFFLNLNDNQNNGFFGDMKIGREFIRQNAKDLNVLNLFSYTCAFSVAAIMGGAKKVVNVDMSKQSLTLGRKNHQLNELNKQKSSFMPYNILKSWSRIKKAGPYDLIIIDPPSLQKGSFASTTDYQKIIKRLDELSSEKCTVLAALNNPSLDTKFLLNLFEELAPNFTFKKRLPNPETYPSKEEERSLKNLIFKNQL